MNNCDTTKVDEQTSLQIDIIGIPENCLILTSKDFIDLEKSKGIRQRFPRNDFCSNCFLNCPYSERIENFVFWLRTCKEQVLYIEYEDKKGELKRFLTPKKIRFSKYYTKRFRKSLFSIIPHLISNFSVMFFLTLTVNPTWDLIRSFNLTSDHFHKLIEVLRKRLNRKGIKLDYIKVYEPTEKGIIHVHVVLFLSEFPLKNGKVHLIDKKEFDDIWKLGFTWLGWEENGRRFIWLPLKEERNVKKALNYILKYLSKAHSNLLFSSLIWKSGKGGGLRSWTTSRNISSLLSKKRKKRPYCLVVQYSV